MSQTNSGTGLEDLMRGTTVRVESNGMKDLTNYGVWFLIGGVIAYIVLYLLKPTIVQNTDSTGRPNGTVSWVKALIGAIIAGLIVALIVWVFRRCG